MTTPTLVSEKKKRNTHHWKAIAQAAQRALHDRDLDVERLNACLDVEMEARRITLQRARFWRLVALGLAIVGALAVAALARAVL